MLKFQTTKKKKKKKKKEEENLQRKPKVPFEIKKMITQ
jgi:hypothetical protein